MRDSREILRRMATQLVVRKTTTRRLRRQSGDLLTNGRSHGFDTFTGLSVATPASGSRTYSAHHRDYPYSIIPNGIDTAMADDAIA